MSSRRPLTVRPSIEVSVREARLDERLTSLRAEHEVHMSDVL